MGPFCGRCARCIPSVPVNDCCGCRKIVISLIDRQQRNSARPCSWPVIQMDVNSRTWVRVCVFKLLLQKQNDHQYHQQISQEDRRYRECRNLFGGPGNKQDQRDMSQGKDGHGTRNHPCCLSFHFTAMAKTTTAMAIPPASGITPIA